jgi:glycosyltransferase involved in cell wall biosynthesis
VLLVAPQPFFELRGTPINVLQMTRVLCAAGLDVHLATYAMGEFVDVPGLTYHRCARVPGVRRVPIGFSRQKVAMDAMLAATVARLLLTTRFDVVHAIEESVFFTLPLARLRGIPVIYDLDSSISHQLAYTGAIRRRGVLGLVRRMEAAALRRSRLAITVCSALTDTVRALSPRTRVAQIEDAPLAESLRQPNPSVVGEMRADLGLDGRPVAVYTGNFERYQGLDLLFGAWRLVHTILPEARLLVVGGQPPEIERARADLGRDAATDSLVGSVMFAGQHPPTRMAEVMALADVLVSPRRSGDNTPLKLYSYMYAARPIVATDLPTHRQVLDQTTAVLCAPDERSLADALVMTLRRPDAFAELGRRARERVMREYSPAAFARKLLGAYAQIGVVPPPSALEGEESAGRRRRVSAISPRPAGARPSLIFQEAKDTMRERRDG